MMDCTDYRRAILSDPQCPSEDLRTHVATCSDCTVYTERLLRFESGLQRALRVDTEKLPQGGWLPASAPLRRPTWRIRRRAVAVAASLLVAIGVVGSLWVSSVGVSLAADVVGHMAGEPQAWLRTDLQVPPSALAAVMTRSHLRLKPDAGVVSYASSCLFRGRQVPHLVVQTQGGPVTVMVLVHESVLRPVKFDENGYRGVIVPVEGHGSLAVLQQKPNLNGSAVTELATHIRGALDYMPNDP